MNRDSGRIKRVLDDATRNRRLRKALEALEVDNYHDDPHADLGNGSSTFNLHVISSLVTIILRIFHFVSPHS